ncbi:MAG: hypothetical protein M3Z33_11575 [Actinomycetota bacterium]|nr:hypothetical protein [Actinomycetota bacterium]
MRANRAYRVIVTRSGAAPPFLAAPERLDTVEVVGIDSGEVELFWDCTPTAAGRLARQLKADLAQLQSDEFISTWTQRADVEQI